MGSQEAARRWAETWERAWPTRDAEAIAALYADGATYRSHPMREPVPGGALAYTRREFANERDIRCLFDEPIVEGDRAAIAWWASWVEGAEPVTLAGVTILRFDARGLVVDHVDLWNAEEGRHEPFPGWGA
jgi:hypothetical protein